MSKARIDGRLGQLTPSMALAGRAVRVAGIQSQPWLNGLVGVAEAPDAASGASASPVRWTVRFEPARMSAAELKRIMTAAGVSHDTIRDRANLNHLALDSCLKPVALKEANLSRVRCCVGIDLGSTATRAAVFRDGRVDVICVIPHAEGQHNDSGMMDVGDADRPTRDRLVALMAAASQHLGVVTDVVIG